MTEFMASRADAVDGRARLSSQFAAACIGVDGLVVEGNADGKTTEIGPFYLRESEKKLVGSITYQIVGNSEKTSPFNMDAAGDFTRNHTWIVYAYHSGGGYLQMSTLYVKNWNERNVNHDVYNW